MNLLRAGQRYQPLSKIRSEGSIYSYRQGHHELILTIARPKPSEVEAVRRGKLKMALYAEGPLVVVLFRLLPADGQVSGIAWQSAPFCWHQIPRGERTLPGSRLDPGAQVLLQIVLVDASTGVVQVARAVTLSPSFTRALHAAIRGQAQEIWDEAAYQQALARLGERYPNAEALVAAVQSCAAGALLQRAPT